VGNTGSAQPDNAGAIALIQSQGAASGRKLGANGANDAGREKNSEAFTARLLKIAGPTRNAGIRDLLPDPWGRDTLVA